MTLKLSLIFITLFISQIKAQSLTANRSSSEKISEEDLVVTAPKIKGSLNELLQIRKNDLQVSEGLSAEQMKITGDSDSAQTLRRVTGLTLMGGKYVYVRGLGERYSSVLLNDQSVPSPEPARRIIPLDLFPISLLESVQVKKSYSTDLPGEFGGGTILLKTKSLPSEKTVQFKIGMQNETTDSYLFPQGSSSDWTGQDQGYRKMPASISALIDNRQRIIERIPGISNQGLSKEELFNIGQDLKNNYNLYPTKSERIPNLQFTYGDTWNFEEFKLGTLQALQYTNNFEERKTFSQKFNAQNAQELALDEKANSETYENNIKRSLNSDIGLHFNKTKINFNYLNILDTNNEVSIKTYSITGDSIAERKKTTTEWAERTLERKQIQSEYDVSENTKIILKAQNSQAKRNSPDYKEYSYIKKTDIFELNTDTTGNRRNFEYLTDQTNEISTEVNFNIQQSKIKIGMLNSERNRKSDTYRFHFKNKSTDLNQTDLTKDFDSILNEHKNINGFELMSVTDSADSYTGNQSLQSKFIWSESSLPANIQLGLGFRQEENLTKVQTFYYYEPETALSFSQVKSKDLLPAANLSYEINPKWKTRLAYSKTLARPDFRELSTAPFIDADSGFETIGNPELKTTVIENWDHRYEYYWKEDEFISFGYFYKRFENPIESQFEPSPNLRKTFANSPWAKNHGVEIENRTNLRYIDRDLRRFFLQTNVAFIDSKVDLSNDLQGLQTSKDRALQGQSPYIFNFQIIYENKKNKISAALIYNQIGKRITEVGTQGRPDVYEDANHQLDLNSNYTYSKSSSFNLKIKNLTDPEFKSLQNKEIVKNYRKGAQLGISWTYNM